MSVGNEGKTEMILSKKWRIALCGACALLFACLGFLLASGFTKPIIEWWFTLGAPSQSGLILGCLLVTIGMLLVNLRGKKRAE